MSNEVNAIQIKFINAKRDRPFYLVLYKTVFGKMEMDALQSL